MRLENSFEVPAPPAQAWRLLNDIPRIVPCMPGAELTETVDENTWKAKLSVKLGPIGLSFATDVVREEADETERRVRLSAKARELKGRGGAQATIESSLEPTNGGTRVTIVTDLALQGAVAQYGRGIVADVAAQLVERFADCIASQLESAPSVDGRPAAPPPPSEVRPVGGLGLAFGALWRSFLRLIRRR